ncbi:MAG: hypothetical protein JXB10_14015 [Pirellulales bacterium]|nr:hypothetical protein [Pirellulales bacterium]
MPFIVIFSVPASLVFGLVGSLLLYFKGNAIFGNDPDAPGHFSRATLDTFVRYTVRHLIVCILLALIAGAFLFSWANEMVYGDKTKYLLLTLVYSIGPLIAWIVSTLLLMRLMYVQGPKPWQLLLAGGLQLLLLLAGIPLLAVLDSLISA